MWRRHTVRAHTLVATASAVRAAACVCVRTHTACARMRGHARARTCAGVCTCEHAHILTQTHPSHTRNPSTAGMTSAPARDGWHTHMPRRCRMDGKLPPRHTHRNTHALRQHCGATRRSGVCARNMPRPHMRAHTHTHSRSRARARARTHAHTYLWQPIMPCVRAGSPCHCARLTAVGTSSAGGGRHTGTCAAMLA